MREIVLDTETTGLDAKGGDRVVEIGCLELVNHVPSSKNYHTYINPEQPMPAEAQQVHGLSDEFLADKPVFASVVDGFFTFIGNAPLIIHNAQFDLAFLNAECRRVKKPAIPDERAIDTLLIAGRKFPGSPNSLDALCRRFEVDTSAREKHGALTDAELLAQIYLELIGGRQPGLNLKQSSSATASSAESWAPSLRTRPLTRLLTDDELAAHKKFVDEKLGKKPLWSRS